MANPSTVDARIRRWTRVPPTPKVNMRPTHVGTLLRPFAPLQLSNQQPNMRRTLPPVSPTANYSFARWEGAAVGAKTNTLPHYMFKPSQQGTGPSVASLLRLGPRAAN